MEKLTLRLNEKDLLYCIGKLGLFCDDYIPMWEIITESFLSKFNQHFTESTNYEEINKILQKYLNATLNMYKLDTSFTNYYKRKMYFRVNEDCITLNTVVGMVYHLYKQTKNNKPVYKVEITYNEKDVDQAYAIGELTTDLAIDSKHFKYKITSLK